jgi:hypothetical protein
MQKLHEIWKEPIEKWPGAFWTAVRKRSVFQDQFVVRSFKLAEAAGWVWSPELAAKCRPGWESMGGTTAIEHAMRELRQLESHRSGWKKLASNKRKWDTLITSSVLTEVHNYSNLDWESETVPRGLQQKLTEGFFVTEVASIPAWLQEIVGTTQTAPWYSPRPLHMLQQTLDLEASLHYHETGNPENAKHLWLSCLFRMEPVVFWIPSQSPQTFLCVAEYFGQAVIAWPVVEHSAAGLRVFLLQKLSDVCQLAVKFVDNFKTIRCVPVVWASPLALSSLAVPSAASAAAAAAQPEIAEPGVVLVGRGEEGTLRSVAARRRWRCQLWQLRPRGRRRKLHRGLHWRWFRRRRRHHQGPG